MAKTILDLYRRGNASGPRMTHVRVGKDIMTYMSRGIEWISAHSGGISTFSVQGVGPNWWVLPVGSDYPEILVIVNDHGNHYNWEATADLPLTAFIRLLASVEPGFRKVS